MLARLSSSQSPIPTQAYVRSPRFTDRLAPWVHYVPVQNSYGDLLDALVFFRAHDKAGARIAAAGREWSRRYWREEDLVGYMYRCGKVWSE
jgi:hypothetical protein